MRGDFKGWIYNSPFFPLCKRLLRRSSNRCRPKVISFLLRNLFIFFTTTLTRGLNKETKRLNTEVAVKVAATLTTEVTAAAATISAFGTGTWISVPGRLIVVASASCGPGSCG